MECGQCKRLFEALAETTREHIRYLGKLQIATIRHESASVAVFREIVERLKAARQQALEAYRAHTSRHQKGMSSPLQDAA